MKKHNSPQQRFLSFLDPLQRLSETDQVFLLEHSEVVSANKNEHLIHTGYGQRKYRLQYTKLEAVFPV